MGREAKTFNDFEFKIDVRSRLTNELLRDLLIKSFMVHRGNHRKVMQDMLDHIQLLYMQRTELELRLSGGLTNGKANATSPSEQKLG